VWIFSVALPLAVWPAESRADDEAVVARFERGVQLYEAENYEGALVEFNSAYRLSKNYKLLYNIGICQTAMKDYPAAAETFSRYLSEGGADVSEARRADVQDRLSKLSLMVSPVRVTTDAPPGAVLMVDDRRVATVPLPETLPIKVGRRQFSITAQGRTSTKTLDVSSGDPNAAVSLLLSEVPGPPVAPVAADVQPRRAVEPDAPSFPWAFWGLTAVLGGAAAVTGVLAVDARNELGEKQATFGIDKASLEDTRSKSQTLGIATDVLIGTAVLSAGLSTYLTVRYFGKKKAMTAVTILPMGIGYTRSF
jgi:hypothetical protein